MYEQIEALKQAWTNRYVAVDADRPELRRFEGLTGTVKTVNMNGRALVQFDGHANIGWYDIELPFLTPLDAPLPKLSAEDKKAKAGGAATAGAAKPAAKVGGTAAATGSKPAAKPSGARPSVADMLKMAREQGAIKGGSSPTPVSANVAETAASATEAPVAKAPAAKPVPAKAAAEKSEAKGAKALPPMPAANDTAAKLAWCRAVDGKG